MARDKKRNFHVPLPDDLYAELKAESDNQGLPATVVVREAIAEYVTLQKRKARDESIEEYAREAVGRGEDLDEELEQAAVEHLLEDDIK